MKVAIAGSRSITSYWLVSMILDTIFKDEKPSLVISGGAGGVDTHAITWAKDWNIETQEILADWNSYGKAAGVVRNSEMKEAADKVVVLWDGDSNGALHMAQISKPKLIGFINLGQNILPLAHAVDKMEELKTREYRDSVLVIQLGTTSVRLLTVIRSLIEKEVKR